MSASIDCPQKNNHFSVPQYPVNCDGSQDDLGLLQTTDLKREGPKDHHADSLYGKNSDSGII